MSELNEIIENLKIWLQAVENQSSDENLKSEKFNPEWFASMVDLEESIKTAIQALKEQQQREQGCEYCNEPSMLIDIFQCELKVKNCYIHMCSDGAGIFLNGETTLYMSIDCCPKCGRRLSHE